MINIFNLLLRPFFLLVFITVFPLHSFAGLVDQQNQDHEEWAKFIDRQMTGLMEEDDLPNATVSLVAGGKIIFMQGYGYADMESQTPVNPGNNLFRTGSVSKIFTWTAVMQLVEKGMIDLDQDVTDYIDFELPRSIHGLNRNEPASPVTMRHLLTHTGGFEDVIEGLFRLRAEDHLPLRDYLIKYMPARIFPPGEVMAYSNYGTALAGYIVGHLSGLTFEEYIEEHIFSPLGMTHSSFMQPLPPALQKDLVGAYRKVDGEFRQGGFEYMPAPAGGLSTSAADMALFMLSHLDTGINDRDITQNYRDPVPGSTLEIERESGGSILSQETLSLMHSTLFTHHPLLGGMAYGFKEFSISGIRVVFHAGSSTLFNAGFYLLPEADAGLFICYSGGMYTGQIKVFDAFMQRFFPAEREKILDDTVDDAPIRSSLEYMKGEYQQSRRIETGPDKLLNLLNGVMRVSKKEKGELDVDLLITRSAEGLITEEEDGFNIDVFGSNYRFREFKPGIYKNIDAPALYPFGPLEYIVAEIDPHGRLMLASDGPVTFIRMPFYATTIFAAIVAGFSVFISLATLIYYTSLKLRKLFSRKAGALFNQGKIWQKSHRWSISLIAKWLVTVHAVMILLMLWSLAVTGNPHPVYQLPLSAFGYTSLWTHILDILPAILIVMAIALLILCIVAWKNRWWRTTGRIHYTIYTISSLSLAWLFWYYNLAGF